MAADSKLRYWIEKRSHRRTGFPMATIAYYGPDDRFASKVVVGIFEKSDKEPPLLKKWFATGPDVRLDQQILQEMVDLLREHRVDRIGLVDRIIGCPHEEGIDYPRGEKCPQCPFWANRDRWTGEIIS